ncbi:hypothetical protein BGW39_010652 [Mortierella sp. 14UC]|nr:hypothetical protein BGW39_010652 [Mortierella sp. 14UC]
MTPSQHQQRSKRRRVSTTLLITAIAYLLLPSYSITQTTIPSPPPATDPGPIPVTGAASARSTTRFYILGGLSSTANGSLPLSQFFSLDLTQPWSTTTPSWTKLSTIGAPKNRIFPATFSKNQKSLIVFRSGEPNYIRRYIVASGNWSPSTVNLTYGFREGVGAVTDPNNGLVYIARGYTDVAERSVDVYNVDRDALSELPLPPATEALAQRAYYGNVWCQPRKSILYFGGYALETQPAPTSPVITEFSPSNQTWTTMTALGEPPSLRADHCMTINEDGSRMVVYGGSPTDKSPMSGEIFMFNTLTRTWTKGVSGPPRAYATCTIAGDQLLLWGGITLEKTIAPAEVLIYNMANDTWIKSYTPPAWYSDPSATTSAGSVPVTPNPDSESGSSSSSKTGPIVGGVVGGLVVIAAVVFILFRRRRQRYQQEQKRQSEKSVALDDNDNYHHHNNSNVDNSSALEKLHAGLTVTGDLAADKTRQQEKAELMRLREQLEAQKEQQAELQKQVELLKNQHILGGGTGGLGSSTLDSSSAMYGYQPPIYYPPGTLTTTPPVQPEIFTPFTPNPQGTVLYDPTYKTTTNTTTIPPVPVASGSNVSAPVPSYSSLVPTFNGGVVRSPEGLMHDRQQQQQSRPVYYQNVGSEGRSPPPIGPRPNNPHTLILHSDSPHTVLP